MQKTSLFAFTSSLFFSFSSFHAMEKKERSLKSIDDIPKYYKNVIEELYNQPIMHNEPHKIPIKTLSLKDGNDAKIIDFLSIHAQTPIHYFTKKRFSKGADGKNISTGITLYVPSSNAVDSPETLEKKYEIIINKIKTNWHHSCLKDHPEIGFKKPENTWLLFIKKNSFIQQDLLMGYLAKKLALNLCTEAHHGFLQSDENQHKNTIYLWVKKDNFKKFQKVFKFNQFKPINLPVLQQQKSDQMCGYHVIKNALVGLKFSSNQWLDKSTKFPLTDKLYFNYLTDESYFNFLREGINKKDSWPNIIETFRKKLLLKKLNAEIKKYNDKKGLEGDEIREILKSIHNPNLRDHFTIIDDLESVLSSDNFEEFLENYENAHKKLNDEKIPNYYHAFAISFLCKNTKYRHWIMLAEQKLDSERKIFIANSRNTVIPNNKKLIEFIQKLNNPRITK